MRDETANLVVGDVLKSVENGTWSVVSPRSSTHCHFNTSAVHWGVVEFFRNGETKESIFVLIPFVVGATFAVFSALTAGRSRRIVIEHLLVTRRSMLAARMPEGVHELESTVLLRALEVFGDSQRALKWMREANPALKNDTPLTCHSDRRRPKGSGQYPRTY